MSSVPNRYAFLRILEKFRPMSTSLSTVRKVLCKRESNRFGTELLWNRTHANRDREKFPWQLSPTVATKSDVRMLVVKLQLSTLKWLPRKYDAAPESLHGPLYRNHNHNFTPSRHFLLNCLLKLGQVDLNMRIWADFHCAQRRCKDVVLATVES